MNNTALQILHFTPLHFSPINPSPTDSHFLSLPLSSLFSSSPRQVTFLLSIFSLACFLSRYSNTISFGSSLCFLPRKILMAATSSRRGTELQIPKKWKDREISPERTKVWAEPNKLKTLRKVPVVYYLSRNGQLEQPHFMEVPLSSSEGLYLRGM